MIRREVPRATSPSHIATAVERFGRPYAERIDGLLADGMRTLAEHSHTGPVVRPFFQLCCSGISAMPIQSGALRRGVRSCSIENQERNAYEQPTESGILLM